MKWVKTFAAVCAAAVVGGAGAQAPIKIGFMAELSGPQGALGQDQYDAFMMVVEQNGGKLGGVPVQVHQGRQPAQARSRHADRRQADREGQGADHHRHHVLQRDDGGAQEDHREGGVPDRLATPGPRRSPARSARRTRSSPRGRTTTRPKSSASTRTDKGYKKVIGMAPNYQAGKDFIAGFKRFYKGEVIDEIYTPLNQPDFSAELAQVAAKNPDAVYVFYPGRPRRQLRAPVQAGGPRWARCRCCRRRPPTARRCRRRRTTRSGVISGTFWGPDFNNPASRKFVDDFEKKYNRIPSQYAAQSYDAALLLDSAIGKVKGNVARQEGVHGGAQGGGLQERARQLQVQQQRLPDPGPVHVRGGEGRQGPREPEDDRHAAQGSPGRLSHAVQAAADSMHGAFAATMRSAAIRRGWS